MDNNTVIISSANYKLNQRLRNLLPHCNTLLLTIALKNKIDFAYLNISAFVNDTKWCVAGKYYDLFMYLYGAYEDKMFLTHVPDDIASRYPADIAMLILARGYVKSTDLFTSAVEFNKLQLVKAIYYGGHKTTQITPFDLPTAARLDYMEQGLGLTGTRGDSLCQFLSAAGLLLEGPIGDAYDPFNATDWGQGATYYDNTDFHSHIMTCENFDDY